MPENWGNYPSFPAFLLFSLFFKISRKIRPEAFIFALLINGGK
jgi:hypothetical protein